MGVYFSSARMHINTRCGKRGGWKRTNDKGRENLRRGGAKRSSSQATNDCYNAHKQTIVLCTILMLEYVRFRDKNTECGLSALRYAKHSNISILDDAVRYGEWSLIFYLFVYLFSFHYDLTLPD